ncbi:hypothetical protein BJ085DRAFT_37797 [Dimargaris cristalligena]|uniref:Protein EFR3 n=1 Tax=Dimargaris cristalligena TaxID=215637 RepID=A0A4P9ZY94_9FUNG|nr:hypothetical protein BJ085DRAFT_37797 [Dimargaris cristalligena]|eukprot:RKP37740.1 hypothetical protein BJ085DRAFT_37797 [Dimargaris cristalligena]
MPAPPSESTPTSPDGSAHHSLFHVDRFPIMRRYIKHATLVENCYPYPATADSKPKSNELSYLVFYANSKPAKLAKVGVYLERKIQRELYKRKPHEVEVSLEIFNALLKACQSDLNYFTKSILNSLWSIFLTDNLDLIWAATNTFVKFCQQHNGSTLGIDLRLRATYNMLISKFASFALYDQASADLTAKYCFLGLRAINAVISSEATQISDSHRELEAVLPAILKNLTGVWPTEGEKAHRKLQWTYVQSLGMQNPSVNPDIVSALAWITLKDMVENGNSLNSRFLVAQTIGFINLSNPQWHPSEPIIHLFSHIMASLKPQYRFVLVSELLQELGQVDLSLNAAPAGAPDASSSSVGLNSTTSPSENPGPDGGAGALAESTQSRLEKSYLQAPKKLSLARLLSSLLNGRYTLVGLSVLEILDTLLRHLVVNVLLQDEEEIQIARMQGPSLRQSASLDRFNFAINGQARSDTRSVGQMAGRGPSSSAMVSGGAPSQTSRLSSDQGRSSGTSPPPGPTAPCTIHTDSQQPCSCSRLALGSVVLGSPPLGKSRSSLGPGAHFGSINSGRYFGSSSCPPGHQGTGGSSSGTDPMMMTTIPVRIGDIISELITAVGGLGTHTYYAEQIADIVVHTMEELQIPDESWGDESVTSNSSAYRERLIPHSLSTGEAASARQLAKLRIALLQAVSCVLRTNVQAHIHQPSMIVSTTSLSLIAPTTFLFAEASINVRLHYVQFVIDILYHQNAEYYRNSNTMLVAAFGRPDDGSEVDGESRATPLLPNRSRPGSSGHILQSRRASLIDIESRSQFHRALFNYAMQPSSVGNDVIGIGVILMLLLQRYTHEELVLVLPMMLKLQTFARELKSALAVYLNTMIVMYLLYAAQTFGIPALVDYTEDLIRRRRAVNLWDAVVEGCLLAPRLENIQYHLFELSLVNSETGTIRTLTSSTTNTSSGDSALAAAMTTPLNTRDSPTGDGPPSIPLSVATGLSEFHFEPELLVSVSKVFECLSACKQLLREYPDLQDRLTSNYPAVERPGLLNKQRTTRRMSSRSQIRASLNLDALKGGATRSLLLPPSQLGQSNVSGSPVTSRTTLLSPPTTLGSATDGTSISNAPISNISARNSLEGHPYQEHENVRVENLREALYAQMGGPDSSEQDDTDSELQTQSLTRGTFPRENRRTEIRDVLNSIGITSHESKHIQGGLLAHTPDFNHRM